MAQNPEEEIQEPVEGATQEPEVPMTQEQIDAVTEVQRLVGGDEPTMQEEVDADQAAAEAEGASIFGASEVEAARQLEAGEISPEGYASWQENKPEEQQMVAREEGKQTLREAHEEDLAETKFKPQARLNYTPTDSPNGYLERLMNNKEYEARIFDELGNARNVDGIIREIVSDNHTAAFERGQEFDADRAHINMAGKLYIDIAHKLGMDVSGLDIESQDFRDFLRTSEAILELQSGLALVRDGTRGKFKVMAGGVETKEDRWEKMASRGVFDGSGSPSEYRSGMSEEEWDEMGILGKTLMWIPNTLQYTGHRLGKMGFPTFGMPTAPRFTTVGGEVVGAVAPYVVGVLGALRVGNAMGASNATQFMIAELAGAAADYAFTIEGEGNLANLLDEHDKLPQVLDWMKITEDDPEAAYKNIVEGGLAGGALMMMMMTLKYGSKVAVGVARKFSPESLTDDMMAHLKKMDGGFYKSGADRIVEMHAGLDLGGMWRTIQSFKELGEMSASDTKTLRNLEENFAEKTKGMKAEEIDDIKTKVSADELPLDEKYGVDLIGEEWKNLRGDQRSSVLEFKTGAFKDARRWNDSEKMIRDLNRKEKAGTITAEEKQSLVIAKRRQAIQRNKMTGSHGVNMNEWRQGEQEGSESLKSFLESKGVRVELTEDEIADVRKLRDEGKKFGGGVEDVLANIEDKKIRSSVRSKILKGEDMDEAETEALVEATSLHTEKTVKQLQDEVDELKAGNMTDKDRELFTQARSFKKWLDNLEEGELKQGILDAVASGRPLSQVEKDALKDAGVQKIYDGLRKRGMLGVDSEEVEAVLKEGEDINEAIKDAVKELDVKGAKGVESAEAKVQKAADKLQKLNDKLEANKGDLTPKQLEQVAKAEEGLQVATEDALKIRAMLKDTPHGKLKEALAKEKSAQKSLDKIKARLADDKKPLTKSEQELKDMAEEAKAEAQAEIKTVMNALGKTARGKLRKLLGQLKATETDLGKKTTQLREEQSRGLSAAEESEKAQLKSDINKTELDIKEAEEALKTTETKKLRGLRTLYNRKVAVIGRWKAKVAKGNTLSETEKANKASFEIEVERIEKEIEKARKSYSKTDQAKLRKLDQKQKRKQKKLDELQEELDVATKGAKQVDIDAAQDELNKMLQVQRELAEEGGRSSGVALGRAQELINKARMLAEATDEATGELNDLRAAYGELSVAYKEYASFPKGKAPRPAEIELERAFYNVQKARVAEEDMLRGKRIEDTGANEQRSQAHKLTDQYPVPARSDNPTDVLKSEDWHRGNRNNGNWRAEDIGGLLSEFKDEGAGWGSKKAAESFTDFMDKHQYFRNGSVMRPAFSKYAMPVWLQGSRLLRVSSAVSGTGTSVLALGYGVAATLSRRGFRGLSRGLLSIVSREAREYHHLVKEVQAKQDAIVKSSRPSQRNFFQSVLTPSRRRADVTGSTGKEMEGAAYGMEGSELEHLGRSMDANSMTLLGVRAQNIENEYVRGFMTSLVGLWEVMPREAMGFIDDGIKLASFDQVLRESVVDTVWRAKRAKTANIDYMADMTNALRQLEEEVRGGKVAHNEVRTWLGERLGGDFSDEVDLAIKARDQAWEQQRELTLQQEVAGSMKMLQDVSQHPLGGHFFMFGKTTANTINMGLERTPILGYMFKHMRATTPMGKRDALAKQLVGAGIITAGGLTKKYASDHLLQDKYGNWHIKIPASKKDTLEQLENQFKQQPNLLSSMVASHNDWATSYQGKKQGARTYDLMVEGDREAYLDQYVGEHKGYTIYSMKRFGYGWSIFAGGIMAYDLVTGTANHLPKGKIDGEGGEIGLGEKLASWLTTFTDAYGLADAASGVDDLMRMMDNPEDIMTMIPFMISDSVTPWKGLLQSPSEPLGILLNTRDSRSPDWNAATFWERVLDRNWWGDDDSLPTKRNAVFRPVTRGSRLALLADEKTVADPFEAEMASVDLDISPVRPTSVAGLKDVDTYAYKNAEGQTAYDWITSRAAEIRLGADMDITRRVERYFGKQYVGDKATVLKGLDELKKGSPDQTIIEAGVIAQQAIRKEVLKIRKEYLDRAVIEFKSEQLNNFTSDSGEKLSQSIDARETIRQEARSLRFDNLRNM